MGKRLILAGFLCAAPFAFASAEASSSEAGIAFGRCAVKADRAAAVGLMKTLPLEGDRVDWSSLPLGGASACRTADAAAIPVAALRGGIAQELFRRDFGEFGMQPQRALPDLAGFDLPVEKNTMGAEDPTKTLFLTADCVARSNPNGTERLIKAAPGSGQEQKALESIAPWLSACQGANRMAYGRTDLRSAIVQAAYNVSRRYWTGDMTYAGPAFRPGGVR